MRGSISSKIKTGGGLDPETGGPIPVSSWWSIPVECQYKANELSNKGRYENGGTFQQASYEITTEDMDFTASIVKLINNRGSEVCQKEVISIEVLEDIQRVKIVI